jgi:hypothetical protein
MLERVLNFIAVIRIMTVSERRHEAAGPALQYSTAD